MDTEFNILFANSVLEQKYGRLEGKKFYEEILGITKPYILRKIYKIIDDKEQDTHFRIHDKDNNILKIQAARFENPDSSISISLIIQDITKSVKSTKDLKLIRAFFLEHINKADRILIYISMDGTIIKINKSALSALGRPNEDLRDRSIYEFLAKESRERLKKELKEILNPVKARYQIEKNENPLREIEFILSPISSRDGKIRGIELSSVHK